MRVENEDSMFRQTKIAIFAGLGLLISACETYPIQAGPSQAPPPADPPKLQACPAYKTGEGPLQYRFPDACDGMLQTRSGIRFIPLTAGDPSRGQPGANATVVVNYEGFLEASGTRIDSSYSRGESSVYDIPDLIDGWGQVMQLMSPGDEWVIYLPSALAYGDNGLEGIVPPNSDLIFRVQLEGFLNADALQDIAEGVALGPDMAAWQEYYPWDDDHPELTILDSGVSYIELASGPDTGISPTPADQAVLHYEGRLAETSAFFDSSWSRGEPATFPVGGLIPGFTEMLTLMRPGDRVLVHIPSTSAYGEKGAGDNIPPNSDLMFQINLIDVLSAGKDAETELEAPES